MRLGAELFSQGLAQTDGPVGVAVSGGGDSVALLVLLAETGASLRAVTVDHGLRAESGAEAARVAALCAGLGVPHAVLRWQQRPTGNLQAAARAARYRLIGDWARDGGLSTVALGHTLDDQAETFLLRLARGSGVDGLAAMSVRSRRDGLTYWRPLLAVGRQALRAELEARGIGWSEDPSNEDARFDRIRLRRLLPQLAAAGLTPERLAETARGMQRSRACLERETAALARNVAAPRASGAVRLHRAGLAAAPAELRLRLLSHVLRWISGAPYRPRLRSLERFSAAVLAGRAATLRGTLARPLGSQDIEITREPSAMPLGPAGGGYDGRWRVDPGAGTVGPLGEAGLAQCPDWRASGETRAALAATPALWRNTHLLCAPFAGMTGPWNCSLDGGPESFHASILTH